MKYLVFIAYLLIFYSSFAADNMITDLQNFNQILTQISNILDSCPVVPKLIPPIEFRLPALTAEQQEAGVLKNEFYSLGMNYAHLHNQGHVTTAGFLEDFFLKTIFQNYIHRFLGYDMTFNYQQFQTQPRANRDNEKFNKLFYTLTLGRIKDENKQFIIIDSLESALNSFKNNELLKKLGTAYQRMKVVVEKLQQKVNLTQDETIFKALLQADRLTTDLQIMIFHIMKDATDRYKRNIKAAQTDQEKIDAGNFLATFQPAWVKEPYYQNIINQLDTFIQPQKSYIYKQPGELDLEIPLN